MKHRFSFSQVYSLLIANFGKIGISVILFVILLAIFSNGEISQKGLIIIVIFLGVFTYLLGLFLRKFADEIIIDFDAQTIRLRLASNKEIVETSFDKIKNIQLVGYVTLTIGNRKIIYNDANNVELLNCLKRVIEITKSKEAHQT